MRRQIRKFSVACMAAMILTPPTLAFDGQRPVITVEDWHTLNKVKWEEAGDYKKKTTGVLSAGKLLEIAERTLPHDSSMYKQLKNSLQDVDPETAVEVDITRGFTKEEYQQQSRLEAEEREREYYESGIREEEERIAEEEYERDYDDYDDGGYDPWGSGLETMWMPRGGEADPPRNEGHDFENERDVERHRPDPRDVEADRERRRRHEERERIEHERWEKEREEREAREEKERQEKIKHEREMAKIRAKIPCVIEYQVNLGKAANGGAEVNSPIAGGGVNAGHETTKGVRVKFQTALDPEPCVEFKKEVAKEVKRIIETIR